MTVNGVMTADARYLCFLSGRPIACVRPAVVVCSLSVKYTY